MQASSNKTIFINLKSIQIIIKMDDDDKPDDKPDDKNNNLPEGDKTKGKQQRADFLHKKTNPPKRFFEKEDMERYEELSRSGCNFFFKKIAAKNINFNIRHNPKKKTKESPDILAKLLEKAQEERERTQESHRQDRKEEINRMLKAIDDLKHEKEKLTEEHSNIITNCREGD
jgi:hypothetical protein